MHCLKVGQVRSFFTFAMLNADSQVAKHNNYQDCQLTCISLQNSEFSPTKQQWAEVRAINLAEALQAPLLSPEQPPWRPSWECRERLCQARREPPMLIPRAQGSPAPPPAFIDVARGCGRNLQDTALFRLLPSDANSA